MEDKDVKALLPPPSNTPYLIAIVAMLMIAVSAIVAVTLIRPTQDNSSLYVLILGSIAPTTLALLAFMKAQETHLSVNSRLEQFIRNADGRARAEGELVGRAAGRTAADERTDTLKEGRLGK